MTAAVAGLVLLGAALFPFRGPQERKARWILGGLGTLALLPLAGDPASRPFVALAVGAALLAAPLPLVLAAAGAVVVALQPPAGAPVAATLAGLAVAAAAGALGRGSRLRGGDAPLIGGALLVVILLAFENGALLSWTLLVRTAAGPVVVTGAGIVLGLALLNTLAGVLLVAASRLAPEGASARPLGMVVLRVAVGVALVGVLVAVGRTVGLEGVTEAGAGNLALLVVGVGALGIGLLSSESAEADEAEASWSRPETLGRVAVALALLAALAAGVEGWLRDGTYTTSLTAAWAATVLLGFLALEEGLPLGSLRRALFLLALVPLLVF